jgi:hypothetical protein
MKNVESFETYFLNESVKSKPLPQGFWAKEFVAQTPMVVTAYYKANNKSKSVKDQAVEIEEIIRDLGLFPAGISKKIATERLVQVLRKMDLNDEEIEKMPEKTSSEKGSKSSAIIAQDAYKNAIKVLDKISSYSTEGTILEG